MPIVQVIVAQFPSTAQLVALPSWRAASSCENRSTMVFDSALEGTQPAPARNTSSVKSSQYGFPIAETTLSRLMVALADYPSVNLPFWAWPKNAAILNSTVQRPATPGRFGHVEHFFLRRKAIRDLYRHLIPTKVPNSLSPRSSSWLDALCGVAGHAGDN